MDRGRRHSRWVGPLALLLAASLFYLTSLAPVPQAPTPAATGARPAPPWLLPLDDAYIFIRFAQQITRGHGLRWSDELSSGVTSPAYLVLVIPGQWLAGDLAGWSLWSRWIGLATLWGLGLACVRLLRAVPLAEPWPLVGGLAVVLSGPVGFGALAGMESALNAGAIALACALWCEARWSRPGGEPARAAAGRALAAAALLPLFRPENLALSGIAFVALLGGLGPPVRRRLAPLVLVPGAALATLNWAMTGESKPAGAIVKSITEYAFLDPALLSAAYLFNLLHKVLATYVGLKPRLFPGPLGWLALATAVALAVLLVTRRRRLGRAAKALAVIATVWLALVLLAPLSSMVDWQYMRHHHAGLVLAWLLGLGGPALALERLAAVRGWGRRWRLAAWILPLLVLSGLPYWSGAHDATRNQIHRRHGPAAEWLASRPEKATLMLNDAGLLAVAHDGPAVDVIGLGTPSFGRPHRHGPGAVAETLARYSRRPQVAAVNLDVFDLPQILGRPLLGPPAVENDTLVTEVRGELLDGTALSGTGLDLAYLPDERRHEVRWTAEPSALDPSFAVVLPGPRARPSLQGCRPVPEAVRWRAPEPGLRHRILVGAPPAREAEVGVFAGAPGDDLLARSRLGAGSWTHLDALAPAGERYLTLLRLSGGMPCVESVAFAPPGPADRGRISARFPEDPEAGGNEE